MDELHEEIKDDLNKIKKREFKEKVLKDETHVEVDEIYKRKFVVYFAIGRKTKLILNYHTDYRDVIKSLEGIPEEIRYSDRITFVSDSYVNYLNLLPDY